MASISLDSSLPHLPENFSEASQGGGVASAVDATPPAAVDNDQLDQGAAGPGSSTTVSTSGVATIDGLLRGFKWTLGSITYTDPDNANDYQAGYVVDNDKDTVSAQNEGFSQISAAQLSAVQYALDETGGGGFSVASFTNLGIDYGGSGLGTGTIRVANTSDNVTGLTYYPGDDPYAGDAWMGTDIQSPVQGNYAWNNTLHELGHGLGLKHGHEAKGDYAALSSEWDSLEFTVMTYRSYIDGGTGYSNQTWDYPQTYMMLDIQALQHLYGADFDSNGSDTIYTWNDVTGQGYVNGVLSTNPGGGIGGDANRIFMTIWDGGGIDTYDLSNYHTAMKIDLRPGEWSTFDAAQLARLNGTGSELARGNVANALLYQGDTRSLIDNAIGGSGTDEIIGNVLDNKLDGRGGADTLYGDLGNDILDGGGEDAAADTLIGGFGTDTFYGQNGDDAIFGDYQDVYDQGDRDIIFGGFGKDRIQGGGGDDIIYGDSGTDEQYVLGDDGDSIHGGTGDDTIWAGGADDTVYGGHGQDYVYGGDQNDILYGERDNDVLYGGLGNDTIYGGDGIDEINGGDGNDVIEGGDELENGDFLDGGDGDDHISGGAGGDLLHGGIGTDTLVGGAGNDYYYVDNDKDVIEEDADGGTDYAYSTAYNYTLSNNVEYLTLVEGTEATRAFGGDTNNIIYGNGADNLIEGGGGVDFLDGGNGNDVLKGGAGQDYLIGGLGNDSFYIDAEDINEHGYASVSDNIGQGLIDVIYTSATFILSDDQEVEEIYLKTGADNVIGNMFSNRIIGNTAANKLSGRNGNDTLAGGKGKDSLIGGNDQDFLYGEDDGDVLNGGAQSDELTGGLGKDKLIGGADLDRFVFETVNDSGDDRESADTIQDFEKGEKIDLSALAGDLSWIGKRDFSGGGGGAVGYQKVDGGLLIRVDADGNGDIDMAVFCSDLIRLAKGDFDL